MCGLSHVEPYIQRDALKALDEVTARAPRVDAACAAQVLPGCIEQIASPSASSSSMRLKSELSSKLAMAAWRLSVLHRLENVLRVVCETGGGSGTEGEGRPREAAQRARNLRQAFLRGGGDLAATV